MIDFGHFYQQIAIGPLSHWLETLPCQIEQWKKQRNMDNSTVGKK